MAKTKAVKVHGISGIRFTLCCGHPIDKGHSLDCPGNTKRNVPTAPQGLRRLPERRKK